MENMRRLELKDLEQIISLRIGIQNYDYREIDFNSLLLSCEELEKETIKYLKEHLNKDLYLFGYFIDEKLIANCGFYVDKHFPTYSNPSGIIGYICSVFTLEDYRGKGYQKKLFNVCMNYCKSMGILTFKLSSKNYKAIEMYKSFGFIEDKNVYKYNNS